MKTDQAWEHRIFCSGNNESEFLILYFLTFLLSLGGENWFTCMAQAVQELSG